MTSSNPVETQRNSFLDSFMHYSQKRQLGCEVAKHNLVGDEEPQIVVLAEGPHYRNQIRRFEALRFFMDRKYQPFFESTMTRHWANETDPARIESLEKMVGKESMKDAVGMPNEYALMQALSYAREVGVDGIHDIGNGMKISLGYGFLLDAAKMMRNSPKLHETFSQKAKESSARYEKKVLMPLIEQGIEKYGKVIMTIGAYHKNIDENMRNRKFLSISIK